MGVSVGSSIYNAPAIYESGAGGGGGTIPTTVKINGNDYGVINVGNLLWLTSNLKGGATRQGIEGFYSKQTIQDLNIDGWRIPNEADFVFLNNTFKYQTLKGTEYWYNGGNNNSGFNAAACGYWTGTFLSRFHEQAIFPYYTEIEPNVLNSVAFNESSVSFGNGFLDSDELTVRLCKDA